MDDPFAHIRVGVGVMIFREGQVLLGKRRGAHGAGCWSFPGGHMEKGETVVECALREVREECGRQLELAGVRFQFAARSSAFLPRDYLHLGVVADWRRGEAERREPNKCGGWSWHNALRIGEVPQPMFLFAALAFDAWQTQRTFYDAPDVEPALQRIRIRTA